MRRHASLDELTTPLTPDRHCFVIRLRKHYSTGEKAFAFAFFILVAILGTHPPGNSSVLPNPWHTSTSTSSSSSQALCVLLCRVFAILAKQWPTPTAKADSDANGMEWMHVPMPHAFPVAALPLSNGN